MTIENKQARRAYENAPDELRSLVDKMYTAMHGAYAENSTSVQMTKSPLNNGDAAENLVVEIFLYVCESNGIAWRGLAY